MYVTIKCIKRQYLDIIYMQLLPFENNPETDDLQPDINESFIIYDIRLHRGINKGYFDLLCSFKFYHLPK